MDYCGLEWTPMGTNGHQWIPAVFTVCNWIPQGPIRLQWTPVESNGLLRESNGLHWIPVGPIGLPWAPI
eukprot:11192474-Lingulodinium_polyedra.AAC.1